MSADKLAASYQPEAMKTANISGDEIVGIRVEDNEKSSNAVFKPSAWERRMLICVHISLNLSNFFWTLHRALMTRHRQCDDNLSFPLIFIMWRSVICHELAINATSNTYALKAIFSLIYGMVKENSVNFNVFLALLFVEDLQLFSYSWRHDLLDSNVLRYIFNFPLVFVENFTLASHIISLLILAVLALCMIYCGFSLSTGQMRTLLPLHTLRFLTALVSTVLYIPVLETFISATSCDADNHPVGYKDLTCWDGGHIAILVTAGIGAAFIIGFALLMSLLYFDSSYASKVGKRHGRVDLFYAVVRIILVVVEKTADATTATGVNAAMIALLWGYFFREQPFFNQTINNIRSGIYFSAFSLAISCLLFSLIDGEKIGLIGGGLGVCALSAVGIFYANDFFVKFVSRKVYDSLGKYDLIIAKTTGQERPAAAGLESVRKSYAELLYQNTGDIVKRKAIVENIRVFPGAQYPDIAVRFIQSSYMDKDAVTLANRLLEVATLQFPSSGSVYLQYLGYINSYLTFLRGKERVHMSVMLRKCHLGFDERFLVYLLQQSVRQSDEMGRVSNRDSDLQYTSYIEYQSLENSVKKYHVDTLTELRDFWSALRSGTSARGLASRLSKISALSNKTNELYLKLINRFPNNRNVLLLYSRFLSRVTADFDQANAYIDMANSVESEEIPDEDEIEGGKNGDEMDRKSAAMSKASDASKETRLLRQRRGLISTRLGLPMVEFMRKMNISSLVFLILVIVAAAVAKSIVDGTSASLDLLVTSMIPRRLAQKVFTDVRRVQISAKNDNIEDFKTYFKSLAEITKQWEKDVFPFYDTYALDTNAQKIYQWDPYGKRYMVVNMNAYKASQQLKVSLSNILNNEDLEKVSNDEVDFAVLMKKWSDPDITLQNVDYRYVFDNLDTTWSLFDDVCTIVAQSYASSVASSNVVLYLLFGALVVITIVAGIVVPQRSLNHCFQNQNAILGLFDKLPRNLVLDFVTELEEEVEVISGDSEKAQGTKTAVTTANDDKAGRRFTLKWQYLLLIFCLIGAIPGILAAVLLHNGATQYAPLAFNFSNIRRTDMSQRIYAMGIEVIEQDTTTWRPYWPEAKMLETTIRMNELHDLVSTMLDPFLQDPSTPLYKTLRTGGNCPYRFADGTTDTEKCETRPIPSIGYTKEIIYAGVDTLILRMIREGEIFLEKSGGANFTRTIYDPHLRLMEKLVEDFVFSSSIIEENILNIVLGSISQTSLIVFTLVGFVVVVAISAYYIGFYQTARQYELDNTGLIALLYTIPSAERQKVSELNTFIESGGAVLN